MRQILANRLLIVFVALSPLVHPKAQAQIPASIQGCSVVIQITNGTPPLASSGYGLILTADTGNTYQSIGINNSVGNSGTYSYASNGPTSASLTINDQTDGVTEQTSLNFSDTNQGTFNLSINPPGYTQSGTFIGALGTAPVSVVGMTINCSTLDGASPYGANGTFTFTTDNSSNTYTITGSNSSSGTYSYFRTNRSTGVLQLNDSQTGASTVYVGFTSATTGGYGLVGAAGGFQVGTFSISPNVPGFFSGEVSLGNNVFYLAASSQNIFGYYSTLYFPYVYHYDLGWEYFIDAGNGNNGAYFYDFADSAFFYTEPGLFPYIYDFNAGAWMYYDPLQGQPGRYTSSPRWFYNLSTQTWGNHL